MIKARMALSGLILCALFISGCAFLRGLSGTPIAPGDNQQQYETGRDVAETLDGIPGAVGGVAAAVLAILNILQAFGTRRAKKRADENEKIGRSLISAIEEHEREKDKGGDNPGIPLKHLAAKKSAEMGVTAATHNLVESVTGKVDK